MSGFLAMGGYALWVWSAYALTAVVMLANVLAARNRLRQCLVRMRQMAQSTRRDARA